jgi:hypothetical protein
VFIAKELLVRLTAGCWDAVRVALKKFNYRSFGIKNLGEKILSDL